MMDENAKLKEEMKQFKCGMKALKIRERFDNKVTNCRYLNVTK